MKLKRSRVLVISSIIPVKELTNKKNENDILFVTEDHIKKESSDIDFFYMFVFPKSSYILSKVSSKWKEYFNFQSKNKFICRGREIFNFPCILFPKKGKIKNTLVLLSIFMNRKIIKQIIKETKPTVIHAHNIATDAIIARYIYQKYKIPYVITTREDNYIKKIEFLNIQSASQLISLNKSNSFNKLKSINNNISLITHGVGDNFFVDDKEIREKVFTGEVLKLVCLARFLPFKNIDFLINVISNLEREIKIQLNIYGDGPDGQKIQSLVKELNLSNRVFINDRLDQSTVIKVLKEADLFVLMSYPETFGRVFIESLATGLPFIGINNTGIYEIVKNYNVGFFCEKDELDDVLKDLYFNRYKLKQASENTLLCRNQFRWSIISKKLLNIYESFI